MTTDLRDLALDVLRHRLVLSYEALADRVSADEILTRILGAVAAPELKNLETRQKTT